MRAIVCLVFVFVVGVAMAQRSPYAPRPVGYPEVLNRFKGDEDDLPNRLGGTNSTQDQGPLKTPEGSIGDPYLLQQVPKWPREHQPFWYLNQQHIMNHRGQTQAGQQPNRQPGGQVNSQQGGQLNSQQGGQAGRQPSRQQGGQASRQPGGQFNSQQVGQASRQQGGQGSRQQGTQQWNNPQ